MNIIGTLGATLAKTGDTVHVVGNPPRSQHAQLTLHCGESGLSSRLFAPVSLLYSPQVQLTGSGSLLQRAFGDLMKTPFEQMGVRYADNAGRLPVTLQGRLHGGVVNIDGSNSSQFLSGLLMALPLLPDDSTVKVHNLKSRPYIDLTIDVAARFGVEIVNHDYELFDVRGRQSYRCAEFNIEGDWSGASCLLVAGAIAGEITVGNLNSRSAQADKRIVEALRAAGAAVETGDGCVKVAKRHLQAFDFDATDSPDLFPALVALAVYCDGVSTVRGVGRLAGKESNRALTLTGEFAKLNADVRFEGDYMYISGARRLQGAVVDSHNDHRIAMALATAALAADTPVTVVNADCVNKSYPDFWETLKRVSD
jgi:3-phosphoshikimate 1-carboxyvinyltransferase